VNGAFNRPLPLLALSAARGPTENEFGAYRSIRYLHKRFREQFRDITHSGTPATDLQLYNTSVIWKKWPLKVRRAVAASVPCLRHWWVIHIFHSVCIGCWGRRFWSDDLESSYTIIYSRPSDGSTHLPCPDIWYLARKWFFTGHIACVIRLPRYSG